MLLIGVSVFSVGVIYTATQSRLSEWKKSNDAPSASLSFEAAAADHANIYCDTNGRGVIFIQHEGGTPIDPNELEVTIKTEDNPTPVTIKLSSASLGSERWRA
ncbi:MAG: type IV pilin, partial [Candidatus Nanohaloarchaea archaeon]